MGLCRVDTDRLRALASRLGAQAVALHGAVPAVGVLTQHGYRDASSDVAQRMVGADGWIEIWRKSLLERADLIDTDRRFFTTPSVTTTEHLRRTTSGAALAAHLGAPAIIAPTLAGEVDGAAMALLRLVNRDAGPEEIEAFFLAMPQPTAIRLAAEHADLVGNLGGAPLSLRILANGLRLTRTLATAQRPDEVDALRQLAELQPKLIVFDWPAGRIAEWIGPVGAQHVAVLVPGTGASVWSYGDLHTQARRMVEADPTDGDLALIAALVHTSPPTLAHAALGGYADRGGGDVERFLAGLDLSDRHVTLIGHSYGSTVLGAALHAGVVAALPKDADVVFLGSPGVRYDRVSDVPVPADHVWVGLIPGDEIVLAVHPRALPEVARCNAGIALPMQACDVDEWLIHGRNPAHPAFGAQVFAADPAGGTRIEHTAYFSLDAQGPSVVLANILRIATGSYGDVDLTRRHGPVERLSPNP